MFYWERLPVINGRFTLRELLSEKLIQILDNDFDLDTEVERFENTPCTGVYCLEFSNAFLILNKTNLIDELFIENLNTNKKWHIHQNWKGIKEDLTIEKNKNEEYICSYETVMPIQNGLLENMRMLCLNGQIVDKDGRGLSE